MALPLNNSISHSLGLIYSKKSVVLEKFPQCYARERFNPQVIGKHHIMMSYYCHHAAELAWLLDVHGSSIWLTTSDDDSETKLNNIAAFFKKAHALCAKGEVSNSDLDCLSNVVHEFVVSHEKLTEDTIFVLYLVFSLRLIKPQFFHKKTAIVPESSWVLLLVFWYDFSSL